MNGVSEENDLRFSTIVLDARNVVTACVKLLGSRGTLNGSAHRIAIVLDHVDDWQLEHCRQIV